MISLFLNRERNRYTLMHIELLQGICSVKILVLIFFTIYNATSVTEVKNSVTASVSVK
jgi:hypothetical protein